MTNAILCTCVALCAGTRRRALATRECPNCSYTFFTVTRQAKLSNVPTP
jgi:hypothetical protein